MSARLVVFILEFVIVLWLLRRYENTINGIKRWLDSHDRTLDHHDKLLNKPIEIPSLVAKLRNIKYAIHNATEYYGYSSTDTYFIEGSKMYIQVLDTTYPMYILGDDGYYALVGVSDEYYIEYKLLCTLDEAEVIKEVFGEWKN